MNSSDDMNLKRPRDKLRMAGTIIRCRLTGHLENALDARPKVNYDAGDGNIFLPFARAYIDDTMTFEYTSPYREIGRILAEIVAEYEEAHGVTVDKTQLLFWRDQSCVYSRMMKRASYFTSSVPKRRVRGSVGRLCPLIRW